MPFWRKDDKKEKVNYKARFEHKQYLAQESPEPVYDLSDCALKNVPPGIFSRCKVLRKEALLLQENELKSLNGGGPLSDLQHLKVLDLQKNNLDKLPDDISQLTNLKVLYLQNNNLDKLPDDISQLTNLKVLYLQNNKLKQLPSSISGLTCLKTLDLRSNSKLKEIPKELAHLRLLETLLLDQEHITYPSPDILEQGTEAIMRFLCSECSIDYIPPSQCTEITIENGINGMKNGSNILPTDPYEELVKSHLEKEEKIKEEKKKQVLDLERQMIESQERELELKRQSAENRKRLLDNLAEEESKKEAEVMRLQTIKEEERHKLNSRMIEAEAQSDSLIKELMEHNSNKYSDPEKVMAALEEDRLALEAQFTIAQEDIESLREKEVMRNMQMMMEEEMQKQATKKQYEQRQGVIKHAMSSTLENDKAVEEVLQTKGKKQTDLISKMLEDEKYQREAFQALLLQQDQKAGEITDQMSMIQNELAALTVVEMKKRDMKVEFEMELMTEKRETLTKLLLDLMERKQQRADDLQRMMKEMETGKEEEQEYYWLIQYQKLLDSKPKGLANAEKNLDSKVKDLLSSCGGDEYIPLFAKKQISMKQLQYMQDKELKELGVTSEYIRKKIQAGAEEFQSNDQMLQEKINGATNGVSGEASAPPGEMDDSLPSAPADEDVPSAPPIETFQSAECVVCLERKCDIIFLPCGHLCSCSQCDRNLSECPLCRATIMQRVKL